MTYLDMASWNIFHSLFGPRQNTGLFIEGPLPLLRGDKEDRIRLHSA